MLSSKNSQIRVLDGTQTELNVVNKFTLFLVSDDEAQELLLPSNITQLEDWEIPMPSHQNELELQTIQTDSQVFLGPRWVALGLLNCAL